MTVRSDNFNRADTTNNIGSPSDGGSAWVQSVGTWGINTNQGYESGGVAQQNLAYLESSVTDADPKVTLNGTASDCGVLGRFVDTAHYYIFIYTSGTGLRLFLDNGGFVQLGSTVTYTAAAGDILDMNMNGSSFTCSVNGVSKITATDSTVSGTKHGLRTFADTTVRFDNFATGTSGASLTANSVTLSEVLGHPAVSQTHILSATGIHTAPVLGASTITQNQALAAGSITAHIPVLGDPTLASGATALSAQSIVMRPVFSTPDIGPLPTAIFHGAPVWWRGWPFDEEEEEKPDVVNEIIEVPETPHETPTEDVVIARAKIIGVRLTPIQYDQVISRTLESMRDELRQMRREGRSMREAQDRVEREIRKRAKRLKEDEEVLLLS